MGFFIFTFEKQIVAFSLPLWPMFTFIRYEAELAANYRSGISVIDYIRKRAALN